MVEDACGDEVRYWRPMSSQSYAAIFGPRTVEFRAALPMTGAGNIQKSELRKPFWEGKTRAVN